MATSETWLFILTWSWSKLPIHGRKAFLAQVDSVGSKELVNLGPLMSRSFFVRVDMMVKHPFLVTKLSPYYDR